MPPAADRRSCSASSRTPEPAHRPRARCRPDAVPAPARRPGRGRPGRRRTRSQVNVGAPVPAPGDQLVDSVPPSRTRPRAAGQAVGVAGVDQPGPVADHLGDGPGRGGHHRHPGRHGLQRREAESLVPGRVGQHGRPAAGRRPGGVVEVAGPHDPVPRPATRPRPSANGSAPHPSPPTTTRATSGWAAATAANGRHQQRVVLAGLDGPDGQDVAVAPVGQVRMRGRPSPASPGVGPPASGGDPVVDGPDPVGVDPELGHHLGRPRTATACAPRPPRPRPGG